MLNTAKTKNIAEDHQMYPKQDLSSMFFPFFGFLLLQNKQVQQTMSYDLSFHFIFDQLQIKIYQQHHEIFFASLWELRYIYVLSDLLRSWMSQF